MTILSIDLGKTHSVACWYQPVDDAHEFRTVCSRPQDFHDLLTDRAVDRVVIEICDMAGWVVDLCRALQIPVHVANVNTEGWRWKNTKKKTDREDALKLARLSSMNQVPLVHVPQRPVRQWRSLILYRHKLVERRTAIKNAIHAILVSEGKAMSRGPKAWSEESMSQLRLLARPLEECAKDDLWRGHLQMELENLDDLQKQVAKAELKLDALGQADAGVIRLQTIPGVGPRLGELVVAMIDDPKRFKNARQVGAYAGLTPRRYQSGAMDRSGRISRRGSGKLRKVLVQVAWGMLRNNTHGSKVFQQISKGQKSRRKQAAVALARRVLCWSWAMLRDGTDWHDPQAGRRTTAAMPVCMTG
jgi:transposase